MFLKAYYQKVFKKIYERQHKKYFIRFLFYLFSSREVPCERKEIFFCEGSVQSKNGFQNVRQLIESVIGVLKSGTTQSFAKLRIAQSFNVGYK